MVRSWRGGSAWEGPYNPRGLRCLPLFEGCNSRTVKPFSNEADTQRKLEDRDRNSEQRCQWVTLPDETEQHGEVASDEQRRSNDADQGKDPRHQARLVQQAAQQHVVDGRHEALSEEKDAVIQ